MLRPRIGRVVKSGLGLFSPTILWKAGPKQIKGGNVEDRRTRSEAEDARERFEKHLVLDNKMMPKIQALSLKEKPKEKPKARKHEGVVKSKKFFV